MRPMIFWNVYLNGKEIDSVPYTPDCDKDYVLRSLIDHDGYDPGITVRRRAGYGTRSRRGTPLWQEDARTEIKAVVEALRSAGYHATGKRLPKSIDAPYWLTMTVVVPGIMRTGDPNATEEDYRFYREQHRRIEDIVLKVTGRDAFFNVSAADYNGQHVFIDMIPQPRGAMKVREPPEGQDSLAAFGMRRSPRCQCQRR